MSWTTPTTRSLFIYGSTLFLSQLVLFNFQFTVYLYLLSSSSQTLPYSYLGSVWFRAEPSSYIFSYTLRLDLLLILSH